MDNKTSGKMMKRKNPYMILDVTPFRDTRLSWKAKGLMTYFLDKPEGWEFYLEHIYTQAPDGEKAVRSGIKELQKYGYIVRVAYRKNKKVDHYGFLVYEQPVAYPSESPIHVDIDEWENHLKNGGDIDITLFAQNRKAAKTLDTSLVAQNQQAGNQQAGNQQAGNAGLLNTNNNQVLNESNTNDDDKPSPSVDKKPWEDDTVYQQIRQGVVAYGEKITSDKSVYDLYQKAVNEYGEQQLLKAFFEYIGEVVSGGKKPEIAWFLGGGYNRFINANKKKKQPQQQPQHEGEKLPKAVQEQMERKKQQQEQQNQEQQQQDQKKEESLEEKRARIKRKLAESRAKLSRRNATTSTSNATV